MENSLRDKDEQTQREREQLEKRISDDDAALRAARTTIEELRAEMATRGTADAERTAEQERAREEWRARLTQLDGEKETLRAQVESIEGELRAVQTRANEAESNVRQVRSGSCQAMRTQFCSSFS